jgi:transcriptional regulator with XRE-family HTH domain
MEKFYAKKWTCQGVSRHAIIMSFLEAGERRQQAMAQTTATGLPTIGDVIRAWRKYHGLRSKELAAKAGVRSQYLSEIEHNRTANPKEEYLVKLADALGVPLQDIYGRQMPPEKGEDDEAEQEEDQQISMANPAIALPKSRFRTSREKFKDIIASARLTDEDEEKVFAAFVEIARPILALIKTQGGRERKVKR